MATGENIQIDRTPESETTEKTIKGGILNYLKDRTNSVTVQLGKLLRGRISTIVIGVSLGLAFALAGVILALAVRT